ncbi:hypothetical protein [Erythrobacter sp. THAF29]|uniref:hypothetical protein n=1 Tax=Erythrobacter sp. THAF29 TaxID=2587851 RepID=UPI001267AD85|nr:hypothetical protein [Erythrobacter sp. THAF29]QFT76318.1 tRNA (guanine-N(7)-)-methyltransferase [Erythrobacter sp. THAF29]
MFKELIKKVGMAVAPELTLELLSARSQKLIIEIEERTGMLAASHKFVAEHGRTVLRGPFQGLRYSERVARERNQVHRLVGSYENELYAWCEEIIERQYPVLLDIGTADGFYAVGFARRMPDTRIIGFDTDRWAREATQELAEENGTGNVEVLSMCSPDWLHRNLEPDTLIFSDCEGYEMVLFNPNLLPGLLECDMVIELHERPAPGVEKAIRERFEGSHDIRMVTYGEHDPAEFPELEVIEPEMRAQAISEGRGGPQNVLFLTRRQAN